MGENQDFIQPELEGIDEDKPSYEQLPDETREQYEARKAAAGNIADTEAAKKIDASAVDRDELLKKLGIKQQAAAAPKTPVPGKITRGDVDIYGKSNWSELSRIERLLADLQTQNPKLADTYDGALFAVLRSVISSGDANVRNLHKLFVSSTSNRGAEEAFRRAVHFVQFSSQEDRLSLLDHLTHRLKVARGELPPDPVQLTLPVLPGESAETDEPADTDQPPEVNSGRLR